MMAFDLNKAVETAEDKKDMSIYQAAKRVGKSPTSFYTMLYKTKYPRIDTLEAMAKGFGVPLTTFIKWGL